MAIGISLFPQLTDEIINKVGIQPEEFEFYYTKDDEEFGLRCDSIDGSMSVYKLVDENGLWTPDDFDLGIRKNIDFRSSINLFGANGVACKDATIGVAIMWTSVQSRQRGVIELGELEYRLGPQTVEVSHLFKKAQLRGTVQFDIVLYIKQPANRIGEDENILANEKGFLLGSIGEVIGIQLDGSGSLFPVYEEARPGYPLWRVTCQWEDPCYDLFGESVKIYLNKAHPSFKYIDKTNKKYVPQLLQEIMASALTIVITRLKSDEAAWGLIENNTSAQSGSLAEAIHYFRNALEWKMDNAEVTSLSIREFFERNM